MNNLNDTVLLAASIQGALLFLGLISKKANNRVSNVSVGIIVFVITGTILFSWGSATHYNNSEDAFPFWVLQSYWLLPPAFWLFLKVNTDPYFKLSRHHLFLFLPAGLEIGFQVLLKFYPFVQHWAFIVRSETWFFFVEVLPLVSTIVVFCAYFMKLLALKQQAREVPGAYSYFKRFFLVFGFLLLIPAVWIASTFYLIPFKIIETILVSLIFLLGYVAYFKPDFFEIPLLKLRPLTQGFSGFDDNVEILRLQKVFTEDSIYLRSKLTVAELAEELGLPVKYVSYLISNYYGKNFNDFVNGFRVREVISKISDPKESHKTLLGMALDSGFNSKSGFNLVFKKHTGKTPSEFFRK